MQIIIVIDVKQKVRVACIFHKYAKIMGFLKYKQFIVIISFRNKRERKKITFLTNFIDFLSATLIVIYP